MSDRYITDTVNFRDWIRGEGEFSEENLRKARDEFFTKMGQRLRQKMLEAVEEALGPTNALDAAPAATARTDAATGEPGGGEGAGDIPDSRTDAQKPVAWAVVCKEMTGIDVYDDAYDAAEYATVLNRKGWTANVVRLVPQSSPTLTDEEREALTQAIGIVDWHKAYFSRLEKDEPLPPAALRKLLYDSEEPMTDKQEPVAWRVFDTDGSEAVYVLKEEASAAAYEMNWSIEPLYRAPALTDEELAAIAGAIESAHSRGACQWADTLRSLLERTK